jgi:hypothetical protein
MILHPPEISETPDMGPKRSADMAETAWGACDICLMADRVASLRGGSTHKVYRAWRFEATLRGGDAEPDVTLFALSIDPALLLASQSRYALVQLANRGAGAGGSAATFSWSATTIGTSDPFATGQDQVRQRLEAAGWRQDAIVSTYYTKTDPSLRGGAVPAMPSSGGAAIVPAPSTTTTAAGTVGAAQVRVARDAQGAITGLDGWETDGGACGTPLDHAPASGRPNMDR